MNNDRRPKPVSSESGACPYDDLYVYQLGGKLTSDKNLPLNGFVGNWMEDNFSFLFFSKPADDVIKDLLRIQPQLTLVDRYHMSYEQWQGEKFTAFDQGCFRIIPPWENCHSSRPDKCRIILDPGIVFGTGTHPTTRNCLDAVQLACREGAPVRVLDLGTGTGLLALATARLGSRRNLAVDLNLLAAKTAENNVRLNHLDQKIAVVQGDALTFVGCPSDLMIANIHYEVTKRLIRTKGFAAQKRFILSGLLRSEAKQVRIELERLPAKILKSWTHNGIWHTFYGEIVN
jgi:ribosomal protein L11 methyltransferase